MPTRAWEVHKLQVLPQLDLPFDAAMVHSLGVRQTHVIEDRLEGMKAWRERRASGVQRTVSDDGALLVEDDGAVRHLVLNRPDKLNALDLDQHVRIKRAVEEAERRALRCACWRSPETVARSAPAMTCAPMRPLARIRSSVDAWIWTSVPGPRSCSSLRPSCGPARKPTVVLLHGHALGSGYDYSLSCDFRLATEDVNYGDPRIHRALWAAEGWSYKLPRSWINQSAVTPIAYLGRAMDGVVGLYERGLVHRVYPTGADLRAAARPFLQQLATLDADAYAETKARILASVDLGFQQAISVQP